MIDVEKRASFIASLAGGAAIIVLGSHTDETEIAQIMEVCRSNFLHLTSFQEVVEVVEEISENRQIFVTCLNDVVELRQAAESIDSDRPTVYIFLIDDRSDKSVILADIISGCKLH